MIRIFAIVLIIFVSAADAAIVLNEESGISVDIQMQEGHILGIYVNDKANKILYSHPFKYPEYVGKPPKMSFMDLNSDDMVDIVIEISTDGGFRPYILLSTKTGYSLAYSEIVIFDYDTYNEKMYSGEVTKNTEPKYFLNDVDSDGINELVFNNLIVKNVLYKKPYLKLNETQDLYVLMIRD